MYLFSSFSLILPGSYDKLLKCNLGGVGEPDPLCTVNSLNELQALPPLRSGRTQLPFTGLKAAALLPSSGEPA